MELTEYRIEAPKTRKNMGSVEADLQHMIIGIFSEFNEMEDALSRKDEVNVLEELGDWSWYIVNHADINGFPLVQKKEANQTYGVKELLYFTSKLANTVKRVAIYKKPAEESLSEQAAMLQHAFDCICNFRRPDGKGVYDINDAWRRNINKLQKGKGARYKDAVYTDQAALHRDEAAERKELEK